LGYRIPFRDKDPPKALRRVVFRLLDNQPKSCRILALGLTHFVWRDMMGDEGLICLPLMLCAPPFVPILPASGTVPGALQIRV